MTPVSEDKQIIVGVTGASGAIYARRLVECLCAAGATVHLIVTPNGKRLFHDELDITDVSDMGLLGHACVQLVHHAYRDVGSVLGSGSFPTHGMVVCPCSGNTLAAIAAGLSNNLLDRAAAVALKEGRRLILVPRETPLSRIELQNLLRVCEAGGTICPASPGFYMRPASIDELVDFVVGKVLDLLGVGHELRTRWADQLASQKITRPLAST
jgi:4-hydroxy-3-polyprenylbenzoate decarboxylase